MKQQETEFSKRQEADKVKERLVGEGEGGRETGGRQFRWSDRRLGSDVHVRALL